MIEILVEEIYSFKGLPVKLGSFHSKLFLLFFTFLSSYTCRSSPPVYHQSTTDPRRYSSFFCLSVSSLLLLLVLWLLRVEVALQTGACLPDPWCLKIFKCMKSSNTHKHWEDYSVNAAIPPDILQLFTSPRSWKDAVATVHWETCKLVFFDKHLLNSFKVILYL